MTVEAPMVAVTLGSSLVIRGKVTDVSPGTKSDDLTLRFPTGVPAVSDESMSDWMLYVYKQFPQPTNAAGVPVKIDVIDANGNYRNIGTVTSDSSGMFTLNWQPDIEGPYKVIATFSGSKAYWPSSAETSFVVDPAPVVTPPETPVEQPSMADTWMLPGIGIIVAAIAIVGVVLAMLLKKRA
jgi:hypothetical protein